eukprot:TRINITY_DN10066_c0_g1_i1.p1 TRINITY_DN10066_c0_g1~~TRINITY_DN10066_c0_g1_i1.p1  ORF type:complete len:775 (-),score=101.06 TRINITY_DN10066_c0_g1_i1:167-2491(-)
MRLAVALSLVVLSSFVQLFLAWSEDEGPLRYGEELYLRSDVLGDKPVFVDVCGMGCHGNELCTSAALSPDRGGWPTSSWTLEEHGSTTSREDRLPGVREALHIRNLYDQGFYLDVRGSGCQGQRSLCVSASSMSFRDGNSGSWSIELVSSDATRTELRDGDVVRIRSLHGAGGLLEAVGGACQWQVCLAVVPEAVDRAPNPSAQWRLVRARSASRVRGWQGAAAIYAQAVRVAQSKAQARGGQALLAAPAKSQEFDYVVVGAGTAGSVVAARLASTGASVALIEAGGLPAWDLTRSCNPFEAGVRWPEARIQLKGCGSSYRSLRLCSLLQGKALGGSSVVNSQIYTRTPPGDLPQLPVDDVLAAYLAVEAELPKVLVSPTREELAETHLHTMIDALEAEVPNLHWRLNPHEDGKPLARISGFFRSQSPFRNLSAGPDVITRVRRPDLACHAQLNGWSQRATPYAVLLGNAKRRPRSLRVLPNASVAQLIFDGTRAAGVEIAASSDGKPAQVVRARREIILSAGALGTPRVLHASGLAAERNAAGDSFFPLRDKLKVWQMVSFPGVVCPSANMEQIVYLNVSTPNSASPHDSPEFQLYMSDGCCEEHDGHHYCFIIGVVLLRPSSPGRVRFPSDAGAVAEYELTLFRSDVKRFELITRLLASVANRTHAMLSKELNLSALTVRLDRLMHESGAAFENELRSRVSNWNHPSSTCPIDQVLDRRLRVLGVEGLRVADASAFPVPASGHSEAAARMLGHLAAKYIAEDWAAASASAAT